ncbi:hypothetical protein PFISCL1PPCAC_23575, partial [Pristionchus fissidentatus]
VFQMSGHNSEDEEAKDVLGPKPTFDGTKIMAAWNQRNAAGLPGSSMASEGNGPAAAASKQPIVDPAARLGQNEILSPSAPPKHFFLGAFEQTLQQAADFETYKLKNDTEGTWRRRLSTMVYSHQPSELQKSFHHLRLLAEANMLVADPWSIRTIMELRLFMILDDGCLHRVCFSASRQYVTDIEKVLMLHPQRRDRSLPPSLQFVSPLCAVVCDGGRVLTVYETNTERTTWEQFFEYRIIGPQAPGTKPGCDRPPPGFDFGFYIMDARLTHSKQQIDVCLRGVRDYDDGRPSENFVRWITIQIADPKVHNWTVKRAKSIVCPGDIEFIGFDRKCDHLITVGTKPPKVESDDVAPVEQPDPALAQVLIEREKDHLTNKILYTWLQTEDMAKVYCRLEQEYSYLLKQEDILFEATEGHLKVKVKDEVVFDGELGGLVDTEATTWKLWKPMEGMRRIEFTFKKKKATSGDAPMWLEVVKGDGRGKYVENQGEVDYIMQSLDIEFTNNELPIKYWEGARDQASSSLLDETEDCDKDETNRTMWYLGETTNHIEHYCDLTGHQIVFGMKAFPGLCLTRALCLREGDHGYVYNFEIFPPRHIQILKAFGNLVVGKPSRKFVGVSPHGGYGVVVESTKQATVYWQSNSFTGELDQYKDCTKRPYDSKDKVCPMQIVNMREHENDEDVDEDILGYIATEDTLILLSCDTLVFHRLRLPPRKWTRTAEESKLTTS